MQTTATSTRPATTRYVVHLPGVWAPVPAPTAAAAHRLAATHPAAWVQLLA